MKELFAKASRKLRDRQFWDEALEALSTGGMSLLTKKPAEQKIPDDCCSKTGANKGNGCCKGPQCK